ncbi:hypothetical protein IH992_17035 [Candidatus Poribacteria bacterium]|nr:hypothetical protein [Candidatus Poribacteria bacterium]
MQAFPSEVTPLLGFNAAINRLPELVLHGQGYENDSALRIVGIQGGQLSGILWRLPLASGIGEWEVA